MFTLQNKGSYNGVVWQVKMIGVVFTLQNKGSYNVKTPNIYGLIVVFTLQNKGISPLTPKGGTLKCKKIIISKYKISKTILHAKLVAPPSGVGGLLCCVYPSK
ncbi:hypothetical protein [Flavobacterium branchiophilum]|uniref:hypothetical protein n=2 Tax=Flavobacterium branchiophilum TaxID=55197 RepID=UPI003B848942